MKTRIYSALQRPADRRLFNLGYDCDSASFKGEWGSPPAHPPENIEPAYLLGRMTFLCEFAASKLPSEMKALLNRTQFP